MSTKRSPPDSLVKAKRRGPPPVAALNAAAALANIERKLAFLLLRIEMASSPVARVRAGQDDILDAALPRSIRQFNSWTSSDIPDELIQKDKVFWKNSNATLLKHEGIARSAAKAVKAAANLRAGETEKESSRALLLRRLAQSNALRNISESEVIRCRREILELKSNIEKLEFAKNAITSKSQGIQAELLADNRNLRKELTKSVAAFKRTSGLKVV